MEVMFNAPEDITCVSKNICYWLFVIHQGEISCINAQVNLMIMVEYYFIIHSPTTYIYLLHLKSINLLEESQY